MAENIFRALLKYANYKEKEPKENIFTGALGYLLGNDPILLKTFVKSVYKKAKKKTPKRYLKDLKIKPQAVHPFHDEQKEEKYKDIIDIDIFNDKVEDFRIWIECKLDAPLGGDYGRGNQAKKYVKDMKGKGYTNGILAIVSRYGNLNVENIKCLQMRWDEIFSIFKEHRMLERNKKTKTDINNYLLDQFLRYMKEEKMSPILLEKNEINDKYFRTTDKLAKILKKLDFENLKSMKSVSIGDDAIWRIFHKKIKRKPYYFYLLFCTKEYLKEYDENLKDDLYICIEADKKFSNKNMIKLGFKKSNFNNWFFKCESLQKLLKRVKIEKQEEEIRKFLSIIEKCK